MTQNVTNYVTWRVTWNQRAVATFSHILGSWGSAGATEHPILLRIQHQGKRRYLSSGISIHKKHWNECRSEVRKDHPQHELLNRRLALQLSEANTAYNELESASQAGIEKHLTSLVSRHPFASQALQAGISYAAIKEGPKHGRIQRPSATSEAYRVI